ncbi:hypothetical protein [Nonomuraea ceibae]|uniref:hypothetical protein n=1 Tax=Nonomuraea ceibae TaxID=1935170 RepID=UPI001C5EEDA8|nr:hypothetical protein [Nonomuraea ceibae]
MARNAKNVKSATSKDDLIKKVARSQKVAPYAVGIKENGDITVSSYHGEETVVGRWWNTPTDD